MSGIAAGTGRRWCGALWAMAAVLGLAGCGDAPDDELQKWMQSQRAQVRPGVQPIAEPRHFTPQAYTGDKAFEPFDSQKLTQALRRESRDPDHAGLLAAELKRRKEALEAFPLDTMSMVGSMSRNGQPVALVSVERQLHQVRVGDHLGLNYGRVVRVGDREVGLREIVQDAAGEWVERMATLQLQETSDKADKAEKAR